MNNEEHHQFTAVVQEGNSDNEFYQRVDLAREESKRIALEAALRFVPSVDDVTDNPIPTVFGFLWKERLSRIRTNLIERNGKTTKDLVRLAARCFEYSKHEAAAMSRLYRTRPSDGQEGEPLTHQYTPDEYADYEGWASTAYNGVAASLQKPQELLHDTAFHEYPLDSDLLEANGLIWFFEAARLQQMGAPDALDMLFEAADALELGGGLFMWSEGYKIGQEERAMQEVDELAATAAATLARRRHVETDAMKADAIRYWKEHIDPSISAAKAANELMNIVPLSHKKLAEIVAAEKKKRL